MGLPFNLLELVMPLFKVKYGLLMEKVHAKKKEKGYSYKKTTLDQVFVAKKNHDHW